MKRLFFLLLGLASIVAGQGATGASVVAPDQNQSMRVRQTVTPMFPRSLLAEGVTSGWARLVIDVDVDGTLADWLVVGHTQVLFAESAIAAVRQWEFFPMVINGRPTAGQVMIGFEYEAKGVVVNITPDVDVVRLAFRSYQETVYRPSTLPELDRIPLPLVWVDPFYPTELEKQGVAGSATVEFYIDETGAVRMPAVVRADFPELGHLLSAAIRQWQFEPPTRRGKPVLVHASQTVTFGKIEE